MVEEYNPPSEQENCLTTYNNFCDRSKKCFSEAAKFSADWLVIEVAGEIKEEINLRLNMSHRDGYLKFTEILLNKNQILN